MSFGRDPRERAWADLKRTLDAHAEAIRGLQQHARQQPQAPPAHYVQLGGARPHEEDDKFREHEARYANTILLLGYGGFFALWSSTAGHMPKMLWGWAGIFICASLLLFIGFELAKTAAGSSLLYTFARRGTELSATEQTAQVNRQIDAVNRHWRGVFVLAALLGMVAGGIVIWCFATHALGHEWQSAAPILQHTPVAKAHGAPRP